MRHTPQLRPPRPLQWLQCQVPPRLHLRPLAFNARDRRCRPGMLILYKCIGFAWKLLHIDVAADLQCAGWLQMIAPCIRPLTSENRINR